MVSFIKQLIDPSTGEVDTGQYKSLRVVGRGTVLLDPKEVLDSAEFKEARQLAKAIVEKSYVNS